MSWNRLVVRRALHDPHGSPAVGLKHEKETSWAVVKIRPEKFMLVRDLNSLPVRYRCSALPVSQRSWVQIPNRPYFFWPYFHYCWGSVHYCEGHFHIYVFIRSSPIWFSYIHIQSSRTFVCYVNGRRESRHNWITIIPVSNDNNNNNYNNNNNISIRP